MQRGMGSDTHTSNGPRRSGWAPARLQTQGRPGVQGTGPIPGLREAEEAAWAAEPSPGICSLQAWVAMVAFVWAALAALPRVRVRLRSPTRSYLSIILER